MTRNSRIAALVLAGLLMLGGLWMQRETGDGWLLLAFGVLVLTGTAFDTAYRGRRIGPVAGAQWRPTGERAIDPETGTVVVVWYDHVSGARAYEPEGRTPDESLTR